MTTNLNKMQAEQHIAQSTPWLEDGNIIIQAENTRFRVDRGVLIAASPILKDMLKLLNDQTEEHVEGFPVVQVHGTAEDWGHVLQALCERSYVHPQTHPAPLSVVLSFLRLGQKYQIQQLFDDGKTRLTFEFPTSLEILDQTQHFSMIKQPEAHGYGVFATFLIDIVRVANEIQLLSVLPWAYYLLATRSSSELTLRDMIYGVRRLGKPGGACLLSQEAQKAILLGREAATKSQFDTTYRWLRGSVSANCTNQAECNTIRSEVMESVFPRAVLPCWALKPWDWVPGKGRMCHGCLEEGKQMHEAGRKLEWDNLPLIFGLPSWEEMRKREFIPELTK